MSGQPNNQFDPKKKFPNMTPVNKAPSMITSHGCGLSVVGRRDHDPETDTYIKTWCISLFYMPIIGLRAYRVSKAPRGWYFLGREPLSALARWWNITLVVSLLVILSVTQYQSYTSTPNYIAARQMTQARKLVDAGRIGQAAHIYQQLAMGSTPQAGNANAAIKGLLDVQCNSAPLKESADVYIAAAMLARRGKDISTSELADKGLKLASDKGESDPQGGVALLDAIRRLVTDTRPIDSQRLIFLRKWAANDPQNLDIISPLAAILHHQGNNDEAKKLLLPLKDKLGDGEGAMVLGSILGHEGDLDGAYALLWPYVKPRLAALHNAEKTASDTSTRIWDEQLQLLKDNKAPSEFYDKYKTASTDQQRTMVSEYLNDKVKNDPAYAAAQIALENVTAVVPVAMDLGMIMLERAQAQTNPQTRKTQMESAEQVFLAIGGIAGETDQYRLSLGQVDYWLGKQTDGNKLFDDFLVAKGRNLESLLAIGGRLRLLGSQAQARTLAEEAYSKANTIAEKDEAATLRALCRKDLDDEIAWLNKADVANPPTKAWLAKVMGEKAYEAGRDDDAVKQYRIALEAYGAMPRSDSTLNELALAYYSIFQATGDHAALERCFDNFQQAVDLNPTNAILVFNAGATVMEAGLNDVIGKEIDLAALHRSGAVNVLGYLYKDQAARDALAMRVKEHPAIARAIAYLQKVIILSPRNARAYEELTSIYRFTRDEEALRGIEQRLKLADLDTTDEIAARLEYLSGAKDEQNRTALTASVKRSEDRAAAMRAKGGATAAVALAGEAEQMIGLAAMGGTVDADRLLALSQEADHFSASTRTVGMIMAVDFYRATRTLCSSDSDFAAFCGKYEKSLGQTYLLAIAASEPSSYQQKVLQNPDFQSAVALIKKGESAFTFAPEPYEWALLKNADPTAAETAAQQIRKSTFEPIYESVALMLNPADESEALDTYWLMEIEGKPQEGRDALAKVQKLGITIPILK